MTATSRDYEELKSTLLEVWVPAIGVRSVADLWTSLIGELQNEDLLTLYEMFHIPKRRIERYSSFRTNFDSYFDSEPPFQVTETFLSGSWSDGLFCLNSRDSSVELPDMDFMAVLKNITYSQEDQASGCLLLRDDTAFLYAFITDYEKQQMWSDYLADDVNSQRLSSKK